MNANLALRYEEGACQHNQALALVLEFDRIRRERKLRPIVTKQAKQ